MKKGDLTKNTKAEALVREFINLSNKFHSHLLSINKYLSNSKISEALEIVEAIKPLASEIEKFKNKLPGRAVLEQENLLGVLKDQQAKIDITSKETDFLFNVRLEIAELATNYARKQLIEKTQEEVGYNNTGKIRNDTSSLMPVTYVNQI